MIDGAATGSLWDCHVGALRKRKLPPIDPFAIKTGLKKMLVIAEMTASESTMKLLRSPVSFGIQTVGLIAGAYW